MIFVLDEFFELLVALWVGQIGGEIAQMFEKLLLDALIDHMSVVAVFGAQGFADKSFKTSLIHLGATDPNDREFVADFFACHEVIEGGDKFDLR